MADERKSRPPLSPEDHKVLKDAYVHAMVGSFLERYRINRRKLSEQNPKSITNSSLPEEALRLTFAEGSDYANQIRDKILKIFTTGDKIIQFYPKELKDAIQQYLDEKNSD